MIAVVSMADYPLSFLNADVNESFIKRNILGGGTDVDINWCGAYCSISSCRFFSCSDEIKANRDETIFISSQSSCCDFVIVCVTSLIKYAWNVV